MLASSAAMISGGKPAGYVGIGCSPTTPASSQCPVVVSLPRELSRRRAKAPRGTVTRSAAASAASLMPSTEKSPSEARCGAENPSERTRLSSVLHAPSPKSAASGAAPTPRLSSTMRNTRLIFFKALRPFPCVRSTRGRGCRGSRGFRRRRPSESSRGSAPRARGLPTRRRAAHARCSPCSRAKRDGT